MVLEKSFPAYSVLDGYCSTVQGLLDWFEVDLGFTELSFIQIDLCVLCDFVLEKNIGIFFDSAGTNNLKLCCANYLILVFSKNLVVHTHCLF